MNKESIVNVFSTLKTISMGSVQSSMCRYQLYSFNELSVQDPRVICF